VLSGQKKMESWLGLEIHENLLYTVWRDRQFTVPGNWYLRYFEHRLAAFSCRIFLQSFTFRPNRHHVLTGCFSVAFLDCLLFSSDILCLVYFLTMPLLGYLMELILLFDPDPGGHLHLSFDGRKLLHVPHIINSDEFPD